MQHTYADADAGAYANTDTGANAYATADVDADADMHADVGELHLVFAKSVRHPLSAFLYVCCGLVFETAGL